MRRPCCCPAHQESRTFSPHLQPDPPPLTERTLELVAYRLGSEATMDLVPAPPRREWMDATPEGYANRCLPLLVANSSGWELRTLVAVRAVWSGGPSLRDLQVLEGSELASSHFGAGVLTFRVPLLLRTPPGWNVLLRGPANRPRDGASPLEGLVETDWAPQAATFNVALTRPGLEVTWEAGDAVAMVVPQRRGDLEEWAPTLSDRMPEDLRREAAEFSRSRAEFLSGGGSEVERRAGWQRHYFQGRTPLGAPAPPGSHQTRRRLRPPTTRP